MAFFILRDKNYGNIIYIVMESLSGIPRIISIFIEIIIIDILIN